MVRKKQHNDGLVDGNIHSKKRPSTTKFQYPGMFYFLILFAASWAMDPRASIQAARSLMVLGVCAFGGTLGGMLSF